MINENSPMWFDELAEIPVETLEHLRRRIGMDVAVDIPAPNVPMTATEVMQRQAECYGRSPAVIFDTSIHVSGFTHWVSNKSDADNIGKLYRPVPERHLCH